MTYKVLQKVASTKTPIFLEAVLAEGYDPTNPMPPMTYSWACVKSGAKADFPETLFLVSDQKDYLNFDYYAKFGGFIISAEFKNILLKHAIEETYQIIPLISLSLSGKQNSGKNYYFLRFISPFSIIDYEGSDYFLKRGANEEQALKCGYGILGFRQIKLKKHEVRQSLFSVTDSIFSQAIIVTNELAGILQRMNFTGFKLNTLEGFAQDYRQRNDPNYIDPRKIERIRAKRNRKAKCKDRAKISNRKAEAAQFNLGKRLFGMREFSYQAFENIGQQIEFKCSGCPQKNTAPLKIYQVGKPINRLFQPVPLLKKSELIKNGVVKKKIFKDSERDEELLLGYTSARFEIVACAQCQKKHIVIFGMGEVQPSREIVEISGVWELVSRE